MVLASIPALYLETQLATLEDQAARLEEIEVQKESQVHALKLTLEQKDELVKDLEAKVDRLQSEKRQSRKYTDQQLVDMLKQVADMKDSAESCEIARRELTTESQDEVAGLKSELSSSEEALKEAKIEFTTCDLDRSNLLLEKNASEEMRRRTEDLEDDLENTRRCCESVPMCNLCRMKMDR